MTSTIARPPALKMHRTQHDPDRMRRLRNRRRGTIDPIDDSDKYSPFSPEALGVDLDGLDLLRHPPCPPDRDLPGTPVDRDTVRNWPIDYRNRWKTNRPAVRQWELLEESFERHRHHPVPVQGTVLDLPYGFFLLNSHMGSGKGVVATFYAAIYRAFGWTVASTMGTKFGIHVGPGQIYNFSLAMPKGTFIVADEVHTIFHSNSSASNRDAAFSDNTTTMRKDELTFLGMSASKRIAPTYKAIVDWIGYVHPLKYDVRRGGNGWKETWRKVHWYGPRPYDRDDFEEEQGFKQSSNVQQFQEVFDSNLLLEAMKLFDSWAKVTTMFGDGYDAEAERADRQAFQMTQPEHQGTPLASDPQSIARQIANWYIGGMFSREQEAYAEHEAGMPSRRRKSQISLDSLNAMFAELRDEDVPNKAITQALRRFNIPISTRGIINIEDIGELVEMYRAAAHRDG